jgi:hypothetical protein
MTNKTNNKRRPVEIYFILYLAALMLLIPDLKDAKRNSTNEISTNSDLFKIYAEKSILITRVSIDSNGYRMVSADSVNFIYYNGNVTNIDFNFQIENKSLNQILNINSTNNLYDFFKYKELPELKAASFQWNPPLLDGRNYIYTVKVNAVAIVNVKDNNTGINSPQKINATTQFMLVVAYYDSRTGLPYIAFNQDSSQTKLVDSNLISGLFKYTNEIFFDFENKIVNALTTDEWTNQVNFFGINLSNELLTKPEISVINSPENNQGSAYIKQISNNSILLAGKTPLFGKSKIKIKLTRKVDRNSVEDEFIVQPIPIQEPSFPSVIFPLQNYKIDPSFPELPKKNFIIKISTENRVILQSNSTDLVNLLVDESYIGKTLYLERFINGKNYGKAYSIQVKAYPAPQIVRIQDVGTHKVKLIVNSFGIINGRDNLIKNVQIEGNGVFSELVGQASTNKQNLIYTQVYEIKPKDENKPFEFKIRVQDQRGEWSNFENYPQ